MWPIFQDLDRAINNLEQGTSLFLGLFCLAVQLVIFSILFLLARRKGELGIARCPKCGRDIACPHCEQDQQLNSAKT